MAYAVRQAMPRPDKLIEKFKACHGNFPYREFQSMMGRLGYEEIKNSGSKRKFLNKETGHYLYLHEPHPQKELKQYIVRQVRDNLAVKGVI